MGESGDMVDGNTVGLVELYSADWDTVGLVESSVPHATSHWEMSFTR